MVAKVPDHAVAVQCCLEQLTDPREGCLRETSEVSAIGLKAVHGGRASGVRLVDDDVLKAMEEMNLVAPAHNPPYIAAMRAFREKLPHVPQVAAFETAFHQTIPLARQVYAIPHEWTEKLGIRRYGFHGLSHSWVARRACFWRPTMC